MRAEQGYAEVVLDRFDGGVALMAENPSSLMKVGEIYDREAATALGLEKGTVTAFIHSGSRTMMKINFSGCSFCILKKASFDSNSLPVSGL